MPVIVDIVIAAAILLAVYLGARSGLLQSLAGVIVVVASGLGASLAAKVLADPVAAWLQPMLTQKLTAQIQSRGAASASAGDMLSIFGFSGQALSRPLALRASAMGEVPSMVIYSIHSDISCTVPEPTLPLM